jgi:hypothetical protein
MPICASDFERSAGVDMSERIALMGGICQFHEKVEPTNYSRRQLHVAFTEATNYAREHVGGKCGGFDPSAKQQL